MSEPTVKRDLGRGSFSLARLDRICEALDIGVEDLIRSDPETRLLTELRELQERELVADPSLLLVTYLVLNDWKFAEIPVSYTHLDVYKRQVFAYVELVAEAEIDAG